jgi:prepilin-type N-terminal cleavage/methylation domain-containing protein
MQLKRYHRNLHQAGDTIVEVIIVLAIFGLALSICYATANRSLLNARQAQENSIATELAQSQIESLRSLASNSSGSNDIFTTSGLFCIVNNTIVTGFTVATLALLTSSTYAEYPTGSPGCNDLTYNLYHTAIQYVAATDTFTTKITWDDVLGQGQDSVTLSYRLHDDSL